MEFDGRGVVDIEVKFDGAGVVDIKLVIAAVLLVLDSDKTPSHTQEDQFAFPKPGNEIRTHSEEIMAMLGIKASCNIDTSVPNSVWKTSAVSAKLPMSG